MTVSPLRAAAACARPFFPTAGLLAIAISVAPVLGAESPDEVHGPVAIWHGDPTTSVSIQWIHRTHADPDTVPGVEGEWTRGTGGFGFSDGDDVTEFEMRDRFERLYIRTQFDVPADADPGDLIVLRALYDDAFIAYVDGTEVARAGVAEGAGAAASGIRDHEADRFEEFTLGPVGVLTGSGGSHVLALEGHNIAIGSSDFSLHATLDVRPATKPDSPGKELVEKRHRWEYLANAQPDEGWTTTLATAAGDAEPPPAAAAGSLAPGSTPGFKLEFRNAAGGGWEPAPLNQRPFADTGNTVYSADLTGLAPDTSYETRFTAAGGSTTPIERTVKTAPATLEEPLRFVTGGDMYHSRDLLDAMNAQCGERDPLFAFLGGDLAYANGRDARRWYDWIDSWAQHCVSKDGRMVPMIAAIGNHEVDGGQPSSPQKAKYYYSFFPLPGERSNFAVDFGNYLSIVALDSDHSQRVSAQNAWLEEALAARADIPYVFPGYHKPAFGTPVKSPQKNVRKHWVPLFQAHGVEVAFEYDHHVYKRTKPLVLDEAGEIHEDTEHGVVYVGDGAWGVGVRQIPDSVHDLDFMEQWASLNHLLEVVIDGEATTVVAYDSRGEAFDEVVVPLRRNRQSATP